MGKGEVVIVVLALALLLCVGSVYCEVSMEHANQQLNQAGDYVRGKAGDFSGAAGNAMDDFSGAAGNAMDGAKKTSESWTAWAKEKIYGMGWLGSDDNIEQGSKRDNGEKTN